MKTYCYILMLLIATSCKDNKNLVNVKPYICPELKATNKLLYEYENSNENVYAVKYMLIEKDSVEENSYSYTFLDRKFEPLAGYNEIREEKYSNFNKMIIVESDLNNEKVIQEIDFDGWKIPFKLEMNKIIEFTSEWNSKSQSNISYAQKSSRRLVDIIDSLDCLNKKVPAIIFKANETIEISNSENVFKQVAESEMTMVYGLGVGLIEMELKLTESLVSILKLKAIYVEEEIEKIIKKNTHGIEI